MLSYTAGIIDGEGHIGIAKSSHPNCKTRNRKPEYHLRVAVKMCDGKIIDYLYGNFGGHIGIKRTDNPKHSKQYYWVISCKKAAAFCKTLIPYLVGKKNQAELAVKFQSGKKQGKTKPVEIQERDYLEMKKMHKTYHASAAAETKYNDSERRSDSPRLQE